METAPWRKLTKWLVITGGTVGLYALLGHWALAFPTALAVLGGTVHFVWCRRNGIHPFRATPRRKYYELRGWAWYD